MKIKFCKRIDCNEIRKERDYLGLEYSRSKRLLSSIYNLAYNGALTPKEIEKFKELISQLGPA